MSEKTGLEVLADLAEQIKLLSKKIDLLDQNVKTLMNKERQTVKVQVPPEKPKEKVKPQAMAVDAPPPKKGKMIIESSKKPGVMTSGKLMTPDKYSQPIADATVKIYNDQDQLIKETKTNRAGLWMAQLIPGRYVAEITGKFKGKDLTQQNKTFKVPDGVESFEVV